jgi:hypothetical protein
LAKFIITKSSRPMHHLLFIQLLSKKTESGYRRIYDAYASHLYAFILPVVESKSGAEELVIKTFTRLWDEPPVLNLHHPDPFLFLLQNMMMQLTDQGAVSQAIRQNMVNRVKGLRRQPQLTVVRPHSSQGDQASVEFMSRPSA